MGGLSRKSAYVNSLRNNGIDPIIIDAGDALFEQIKYPVAKVPAEQFKAKSFLQGMEKIGCAALNIGEYDLAGGYDFIKKLEQNTSVPFVSANLYSVETGQPAFDPYIVIEKNDLKVGIIGVTDNLSGDIKELYKLDYLVEGQKYIDKIRGDVDILIVLVSGMINNRDVILNSFQKADYVFLSRTVMNTRTGNIQKADLPIFYTIGLNGKYLIEIKASIVDESKPIMDISAYKNRIASYERQLIRLKQTKDGQTLEEKYTKNPMVLKQIENYDKQVKELDGKIVAVINRSECQIVPLPEAMDYDRKMQDYIDHILLETGERL